MFIYKCYRLTRRKQLQFLLLSMRESITVVYELFFTLIVILKSQTFSAKTNEIAPVLDLITSCNCELLYSPLGCKWCRRSDQYFTRSHGTYVVELRRLCSVSGRRCAWHNVRHDVWLMYAGLQIPHHPVSHSTERCNCMRDGGLRPS